MTGPDGHLAGVRVTHPEMFWFGTRDDANWFADPADGRYDGGVELRWGRMVETLARITDALRAGDWTVHPDGDSVVDVEISGLTMEEEFAIVSLFSGATIQVDPWDTALTDGRHRTWGFWAYDPAVTLPFESRLLWDAWRTEDPDYTTAQLAPILRADHRAEAGTYLRQVSAGVAARSPRYVDALTRLARSRDVS